jgi:dTDP-4-amino-4,6-dideoxygalactose transaminase
MPAKMGEILEVAGRFGIPVVEDAAEALGSKYRGRFCGGFGEFACLSFNGNKIITTSGGGALVCSNAEAAGVSKFLATQARDSAPHYQHSQVGYNYRLSNICAGIGRGQMLVLEEHIAARRAVNARYRELLAGVPGISFLTGPSDDFESNMWLTCILVDPAVAGFNREDLHLAMEAANIETRPLWKPMHLQPVFADAPRYLNCGAVNCDEERGQNRDQNRGQNRGSAQLPESDNSVCGQLFLHGLCLPSHPGLTDADLERVVCVVQQLAAR